MATFNPNIFLRGADREERQGQRDLNAMQNLSQMMMKQEMLKEAQANELRKEALAREQMAQKEAMKGQNIYIDAISGKDISPERQAAYDFQQSTSGKSYTDEAGNLVRFGQYPELSQGQAPAPQGMPVAQQQATTPEVVRDGQDPFMASLSPKGKVELEKQQIAERMRERKDKRQKEKISKSGVSLVDTMLKYNEKTGSGAYQGLKQPFKRSVGDKEAKAFDLLSQTRLRLAAPLAKQLGVNPTDKDFENTLNQIFNENADRDTRESQLLNVRQLLSGDLSEDEFFGKVFGDGSESESGAIDYMEYFNADR